MAKLITVKSEVYTDAGNVCVFAYFDDTPTEKELKDAGGGKDGFTVPFRDDDELSKHIGLQRWYLAQDC